MMMRKELLLTPKQVRTVVRHIQVRTIKKPKVFILGANKTGTTSLNNFLQKLSFRIGPQKQFSMLLHDYFDGDWEAIFKIIKNLRGLSRLAFFNGYRRIHFRNSESIPQC